MASPRGVDCAHTANQGIRLVSRPGIDLVQCVSPEFSVSVGANRGRLDYVRRALTLFELPYLFEGRISYRFTVHFIRIHRTCFCRRSRRRFDSRVGRGL